MSNGKFVLYDRANEEKWFAATQDDAPCELIEKNMNYNIYEGNRKVAKLKIIECYNNE